MHSAFQPAEVVSDLIPQQQWQCKQHIALKGMGWNLAMMRSIETPAGLGGGMAVKCIKKKPEKF